MQGGSGKNVTSGPASNVASIEEERPPSLEQWLTWLLRLLMRKLPLVLTRWLPRLRMDRRNSASSMDLRGGNTWAAFPDIKRLVSVSSFPADSRKVPSLEMMEIRAWSLTEVTLLRLAIAFEPPNEPPKKGPEKLELEVDPEPNEEDPDRVILASRPIFSLDAVASDSLLLRLMDAMAF